MINGKRTRICDIFEDRISGKEEIEVWGWVRTSRFSKNISFINVNDGSYFNGLQLVAENSILKLDESQLLTGSCVKARGQVIASTGAQAYELKLSALEVFSAADDRFPLQKKKHTQEFLREISHLRPRTNTFLAVGNIRNKLAFAIHSFFQNSGFRYVHTPILTKSDCEGAGETFRVTSQNPAKLSEARQPFRWSEDLFGQEVFLSVSGQLEAEAMALGLGQVYTFGPTFRADPSDTARHASEFWMVEPEMAFYDLDDLKILISKFIKGITQTVWNDCQKEIEFLSKYLEPELAARYKTILEHDFADITYQEAIDLLLKAPKTFATQPEFGNDIATEHERYLVDEVFKKPVFVSNYPKTIKPFYMRQNDDAKTVACLDLLAPSIGEIIGGSQREERFDVLEKKMTELGLGDSYKWYLETRQWGSAPHSGFGLGFERMVMYLTGIKSIKDALAFPRASRKIW